MTNNPDQDLVHRGHLTPKDMSHFADQQDANEPLKNMDF